MMYRVLRKISIPSAGHVELASVLEMDPEEIDCYDGASKGCHLVAQPGHVHELQFSDIRSIDEYLRERGSSLENAVRDDLLLLHIIVVWQLESRLVMDLASHIELYSNVPRTVSEPQFSCGGLEFWIIATGRRHRACTLSFETFEIAVGAEPGDA